MALNKTQLKETLELLFVILQSYDGSPGKTYGDAISTLADGLSNAVDQFVKSGTVTTTVATGIPVQVNITSGTGTTTGPGTGTGVVE